MKENEKINFNTNKQRAIKNENKDVINNKNTVNYNSLNKPKTQKKEIKKDKNSSLLLSKDDLEDFLRNFHSL